MEKRADKLLENLEERLKLFSLLGAEFLLNSSPSSPQAYQEESSFLSLEEKILHCQKCPLAKSRHKAVPGEGNRAAGLMFIGEAPGREEDLQGKPFVGRAGRLLSKIITAMNFQREDVYITNLIKCRPPNNRTPHKEEIESCQEYLCEQIERINPRVIVTLGKVATDFFVRSRLGMTALRGNFYDYNQIPVMPTFHPSYLIRNEGNRQIKRLVWEDMKKVMAFLDKK